MNSIRRSLATCLLVFLGGILAPQLAEAQATFQVSGAASKATANGFFELVGDVLFTVTAGTSAAGQLEITYPVAFTNDLSSGITIVGTGGLAAATASVAGSSGIVVVNVPAGATLGDSVKVTGVRYAASSPNNSAKNATISSAGNFVTAGQGVLPVIQGAAVGFTLQAIPSPAFALANGVIVSGPGEFTITEGYESAFTSDVGQLGQTAPTQIVFRVIGLPDNVTLTFPLGAVSDQGTGATLAAAGPVVLTNQSASNQVVYQFTGTGSSQAAFDIFRITPTVGTTGPAGSGTAFIQVALGPIGLASPNANYPSTAIPRYPESFLPPLSSIPGAIISLNFPTSPLATGQSISVANLGSGGAALNFKAYLSDGSTATSTVNPVLASRETQVFSIPQLFGAGASPATVASVQVESLLNQLLGTSFDSAQGGRTSSTAAGEVQQQFVVPFNLTSTKEATLSIVNQGTGPASVNLRLRGAAGQIIATAALNVVNGTTQRISLLTAFNVPAASVPANAFVEGSSTIPVRINGFSNPSGPVEEVTAQSPVIVRNYRHPFFVTGGGYTSVLQLVNTSGFPVQVTLTPSQTNGLFFAGVSPIVQVIGSFQRADIDFASFFPNGTQFREGYVTMAAERADAPNPFSTPLLVGVMQFRVASASALVPLFTARQATSYLSPVVEDNNAYTGVAMMNDAGFDVSVTIDVFSAVGSLLGTNTFVLPALNLRAQLIRELVPAANGQVNELVRITTTAPIGIIGFRGAWNLSELLYLPPQ